MMKRERDILNPQCLRCTKVCDTKSVDLGKGINTLMTLSYFPCKSLVVIWILEMSVDRFLKHGYRNSGFRRRNPSSFKADSD
jgi:hypothetical protein